MIAAIFWSVHRNLTRSFAAARQLAYSWAAFFVVVIIAVSYGAAQKQRITVPQATGLPVLAIATGCLAYASVQLRRLIGHPAPSVAAAANIEPRRRKQAQYALLTSLALLAAIGAYQINLSLQQQKYLLLFDAAFTFGLAVAFYATTYRSLWRNIVFAKGSAIAWSAVAVCFILYNISSQDVVFAAADTAVLTCVVFALARLWSAKPTRVPMHEFRQAENTFSVRPRG